MAIDYQAIREASRGRGIEVLLALTPLVESQMTKAGSDHPCPKCSGGSVLYPDDRNGGPNQHGRIVCRVCTRGRPPGDLVDSVRIFGGYQTQADAANAIMRLVGMPSETSRETPAIDIIERVCRAKRMPVESFKLFGVTTAQRVGKPVVRVDVYGEHGKVHSHFDMTATDKGFFRAGEGSSGLFLPGRLPTSGETWHLVEGVKDASALTDLGCLTCGLPTSYLASKYCELFRDVEVVIFPDLDQPGFEGAERSASCLFGVAESIRIARLPGEFTAKGGPDVRDAIAKHGPNAVRTAIKNARVWHPSNESSGVAGTLEATEQKLTIDLTGKQPKSVELKVDNVLVTIQIREQISQPGSDTVSPGETSPNSSNATLTDKTNVACPQCGVRMIQADLVVGGWVNQDCPGCGFVKPMRVDEVGGSSREQPSEDSSLQTVLEDTFDLVPVAGSDTFEPG